MRKLLLVAFTSFVALAGPASAQSIGGNYQAAGKNFDGSAYSGTAQISFPNNNACRIRWVTGSTTSAGTCLRKGSTFAAGYALGGVVGLVVYELQPDGSLHGVWTMGDKAGYGTEVLTPVR